MKISLKALVLVVPQTSVGTWKTGVERGFGAHRMHKLVEQVVEPQRQGFGQGASPRSAEPV